MASMPTISNSSSSTITSTEPTTDTSLATTTPPPTKAVGDQHHPHLNTLLEERSHPCQFICNRLRLTHNIKLPFS
jgi:hypothetical protein